MGCRARCGTVSSQGRPGTAAIHVEPSIDPSPPAAGNNGDDVLVLGGSGMVGVQLLRQLAATGAPLPVAVTRSLVIDPSLRGLARWRTGDAWELYNGRGPWPDCATVLSAGPLDALAAWLERERPPGLRRVVALGSTSVSTKQDSSDPGERALAATLDGAQTRLIAWCGQNRVDWTLLRPTLIWGEGRDANLSQLAALARRWPVLPLPGFARGRRQPIRSRDVARAMLLARDCPAASGQCLDLPGGETVEYDEMVRRIARASAPSVRVVTIPGGPAWLALRAARRLGLVDARRAAVLARMREDLVFDGTAARQTLDFVPDGFQPESDDFPSA